MLRKRKGRSPDGAACGVIRENVVKHPDCAVRAAGRSPLLNAVELATEVGRNKPAPAGVSGKLTGPMPEMVASRPYSGLLQNLNSTVLSPLLHPG